MRSRTRSAERGSMRPQSPASSMGAVRRVAAGDPEEARFGMAAELSSKTIKRKGEEKVGLALKNPAIPTISLRLSTSLLLAARRGLSYHFAVRVPVEAGARTQATRG
ncbi:hypothetical protein MPLDJ20_310007 [Mesorhizobium plurifarium]|uniref:Uncharacterized protein n=1 Tax=Mesorhizobium plurifarium TaxID=69974 RepID=A0A090FH25_MESPL|nr:hypothetical protein MPLDJ20_310007 [Mesorhizobium plurifarium]